MPRLQDRKVTKNNEPETDQCTGSFQTPDGSRWYCQNWRHRGVPLAKQRDPHVFDVKNQPVRWRGTADEKSSYCGHDLCTGAPPGQTPATPVEVAFNPDLNDATKEAP